MPLIAVGAPSMHHELCVDGEPLVLIWGLALDAWGVVRLVEAPADRHRAVVGNDRGAGRTDQIEGPSAMQTANGTIGAMDALGARQARVHSVSVGARVATEGKF